MRKKPSFLKQNGFVIFSIVSLTLSVVFLVVSVTILGISQAVNATSVGHIYLGDRTEAEYQGALVLGVNDWRNKAEYTVQFQGHEMSLDLDWFVLDSEATIAALQIDKQNKAYFTIDETDQLALENLFQASFGNTIFQALEIDQFLTQVLLDMRNLYFLKTYQLNDFLTVESQETLIDQHVIQGLNPDIVTNIASKVTRITISNASRFSLLDELSEIVLSNEELSIVASGILNLIQETSISGISKYQYPVLPTWADYGENAMIMRVNQFDLRFFNLEEYDLFVDLEATSTTEITFTLKSYPFVSQYAVSEVAEAIPFETIVIEDDEMDISGITPSETDTEWVYSIVDQAGVPGSVITFTRTITKPDASISSQEFLQEHYLPTSEIIRQKIVLKGD